MDLAKIGFRMWIRLTQIRVQWSALVDTVMNLQEPTKAGECKLYNKTLVLSDAELWNTGTEKETERE